MPKYLHRIAYTIDGAKGLAKEGGSGRKEAATKAIAGAGGTVETFYFAFGDDDVIVIADYPDPVAAAALSITVSSAGGAAVSTTPLLTVEEMDEATKIHPDYRPPGA